MRNWRRIWKGIGGVLAGAIVLAGAGWKVYLDASYFHGYDPHAPLHVQVRETTGTPSCTRVSFYCDGMGGERVPAWLELPKAGRAPYPCVVFLHGIGDDKTFLAHYHLDEYFTAAGFAVVTFDQLMRGEREVHGLSFLQEGAQFRVRAAHTVNDTRRLLDYLETRPDMAHDRVYLCGMSYGAITGATVASFDPRIRAVVLMYGGGNFRELIASEEIQKEVGPWRLPASAVTWYLGGIFDPIRYVGGIAPRPVLLQNGKADTVISPVAGLALQQAARDPKKVLWYEGDHLGKTDDLDMPLAAHVFGDALAFLREQDTQQGKGIS